MTYTTPGLLQRLIEHIPLEPSRRRKFALIAHQHLLPSVVPMFELLTERLIDPAHTYVLGKPYSTIPGVSGDLNARGINVVRNKELYTRGRYAYEILDDVGKLWSRFLQEQDPAGFDRILIIDEGGYLAATVPEQLSTHAIAVEQTASGSFADKEKRVPVIQVALSAAKRFFESPFIGRSIWQRYIAEHGSQEGVIGVIGLGYIGREVARQACNSGFHVVGWDKQGRSDFDNDLFKRATTLAELLRSANIVFGCSGVDCLSGADENNLYRPQVMISGSSGDIEFSSLLVDEKQQVRYESLLDDVYGRSVSSIQILNGGFPYNFNRMSELESKREILLTRALMVAGVAQAAHGGDSVPCARIPLKHEWQKGVVERWIQNCGCHGDANRPVKWWIDNSL